MYCSSMEMRFTASPGSLSPSSLSRKGYLFPLLFFSLCVKQCERSGDHCNPGDQSRLDPGPGRLDKWMDKKPNGHWPTWEIGKYGRIKLKRSIILCVFYDN